MARARQSVDPEITQNPGQTPRSTGRRPAGYRLSPATEEDLLRVADLLRVDPVVLVNVAVDQWLRTAATLQQTLH